MRRFRPEDLCRVPSDIRNFPPPLPPKPKAYVDEGLTNHVQVQRQIRRQAPSQVASQELLQASRNLLPNQMVVPSPTRGYGQKGVLSPGHRRSRSRSREPRQTDAQSIQQAQSQDPRRKALNTNKPLPDLPPEAKARRDSAVNSKEQVPVLLEPPQIPRFTVTRPTPFPGPLKKQEPQSQPDLAHASRGHHRRSSQEVTGTVEKVVTERSNAAETRQGSSYTYIVTNPDPPTLPPCQPNTQSEYTYIVTNPDPPTPPPRIGSLELGDAFPTCMVGTGIPLPEPANKLANRES